MGKSYYKYWGKAKREETDGGEPYHLLAYHSLDVAAVGHVLLDEHPTLSRKLSELTGFSENEFKQWAVFFLALHDVGKFADCFQNLSPEVLKNLQSRRSDREYSERHDSLGYLLWNEVIKEQFVELGIMPAKQGKHGVKPQEQAIDSWMGAVTGHHGEPPKNIAKPLDWFFETDLDFPAVKQYVSDIYTLFGNDQPFPVCEPEKLELASWWLAGFAVLCDWLGSNKKYFPYQTKQTSFSEYWELTIKQAETTIEETGLLGAAVSNELTLQQIIKTKSTEKIELTPLQKMAQNIQLQDSSHLFILEDVTGAGKTEAAVILAHRLMQQKTINGVYFALPTMATANAMYSRMADAYQNFYEKSANKPSLVLAHGASQLSDQFSESIMPDSTEPKENNGDETITAEAHCNQWLTDNRKKSLLADIGVGTIDQALLAILPSRHQSLRLLGLLNKVLIVDEVHACDAYMHVLLCALLKAHAASGGSAILLSATLPESQRQKLVDAYTTGQQWQKSALSKTGLDDYPLMTLLNKKGVREEVLETRETVKRTVKVKLIHTPNEIENLFSEVVKNGQCAVWIRNTVIDARESFEWLKKNHPDWNIDLFHARFAMGDRLDIENRVLDNFGKNSSSENRKGKILIATQVVEQSLDADWDEMVTDLVPIDMVIQRAGRLCRHTRDKAGNRIDGKDQRGQPVLHIYSPALEAEPDNNWYTDFFPKAQKIYENHGQLWLTANLLQKNGQFQMPEDARMLIEGVYGEDSESSIPEELMGSVLDAEGTGKAEASLAKSNALKVDIGYSNDAANHWWDEARTPTRLGEDSIILFLARWHDGKLSPWRIERKHDWSYSSVSARTYWVNQEAISTDIPKDILEECKSSLPAKGKWGVLIPLREKENGLWEGMALNEKGESVTVQYTNSSGLIVK